jgi:transcriptional regulator of acetoin/glycerol metabolism
MARERLRAARRRFLEGGTTPPGSVPETIARSWARCAAHGLDMTTPRTPEPLDGGALAELQARNERLLRLARAELSVLRADAASTDSIAILTDASGLVLAAEGHEGFADRAARVALRPGVAWSEDSTGTNAIGTALAEGRAVQVVGAEHFFEPHRILTCAAAPIRDPRGTLVGVLDLSGYAAVPHAHAAGLVRLAVAQIEHRWFRDGFEHCTVLRVHADDACLGTAREGVLVFEDDRLIGANDAGLTACGLDRGALDEALFETLFERLPTADGRQGLRTRAGGSLHAEVHRPRPARRSVTPPPVRPAVAQDRITPRYDADLEAALDRGTRLVDADVPLLVQGETGTGKEVLARAVHGRSRRGAGPFVAVNCAAIPEALIEAELFGHEDGAFTGARRQGRRGLVAQADGGTLFLDEIGDMPLALQSRLLRVLQDRTVTPLGGSAARPVDFALVCATHQPLRARVEDGSFRGDLYYRIAQYALNLHPLREHADLAGTVMHLWHQLAGERALAQDARDALARHPWPGNYRELVGTLRAVLAVVDHAGPVTLADLPAHFRGDGPTVRPSPTVRSSEHPSSPRTLREHTDAALRAAVAACDGNLSRAARELGIHRSTLYRRLARADATDGHP